MTEPAREPCPLCGTEGKLYTAVPGGTWNSYLGGWEPDETERTCPLCHGACFLTPEQAADLVEYRNPDNTWNTTALEEDHGHATSHLDEPDPDLWFEEYRDREYTRS